MSEETVNQNGVAIREWDDPLPEVASTKALRRYHAVREFARQNLKLGEHFDVLPEEKSKCKGKTELQILQDASIKKFFSQAGADMLNLAWGVHSECEIVAKIEDPDTPHYMYQVRVTLMSANGVALGNAVGMCSSKEGKYAYRWITAQDIKGNPRLRNLNLDDFAKKDFSRDSNRPWVKYRVPNLDVADIAHTIMQMAEKRAYVKITRRVYGISELFNQPIDSFDPNEDQNNAPPPQTTSRRAGRTKQTGTTGEPPAITQLKSLFDERCGIHNVTPKAREDALQEMFAAGKINDWPELCNSDIDSAMRVWLDTYLPENLSGEETQESML